MGCSVWDPPPVKEWCRNGGAAMREKLAKVEGRRNAGLHQGAFVGMVAIPDDGTNRPIFLAVPRGGDVMP